MAGLSDFNYQGYMTAIGVDPSIANRDFTDEEKSMIYQDAVKRFYQAYGQEIKDSPFYSTPKERHEYALEKTLTLLPDGRSMFGLPQQRNPEDIFDTEDFYNFVANEQTGTENMDYLLDTYAARQTDKDRLKWEFGLEGMTKKQFRELFAERTGIDESFTRDDILNRRFGAQYVGEAGEAKKTGYKAAAYKSMLDAKVLGLKTLQTIRDALPGENTESSQWLDRLAENAKKAVEDYGYVGRYDNVTITDAFKEGPFTLAGKIFTSAVESWATSGASIGAAIFLPFVAPGAAAAGGATAAATGLAARVLSKEAIKTITRGGLELISALSSAQEIGGVRQEIEEKGLYDPDNPLDVLMAGAVAASLDRVGAMSARARLAAFRHKAVTEGMRSGLRGEQLTKFLELKMKDSELKQMEKYLKRGFVGNTLMAMGIEGGTEALQEFPGMLLAQHKGHDYSASEWLNRPLEAGLVGAVLGGGTHVAGTLTGKIAGRERTVQDTTEEQKKVRAELAKYQDTGQDNIDAGVRLKVAQRLNTAGDLNMTVDGNTVVLTYGGHLAEVTYDENRHKGFNTPEQKQAMLAEEAVTNIIQQLNESRNKIEENLDTVISRDGDDSVLTIKNPDNRTDTISTRPQNLVIRIKNVTEERGRTILRELVDRHNNDSDALVLRTSQEFDAKNREVDPDVVARAVLDRNNTYMGTRNRRKYALANEEPFEIQIGGLEGDEKNIRGHFGTKNDKGQIKLDDLLQEARNKGYEIIGNPTPNNLIITKNGVVFQLSINNREAGNKSKSGNFPVSVDVVTTDVARGTRSRKETIDVRDDAGNLVNGGIVSIIPSIPGLRILPGTQENDNLPRINSDDFTDFANMIGTDVTDPNQIGSIRRVEYSYEENGERKTRTLSFYVMGRKGGGAKIFVHNGKRFVSEMISLNDLSNLEDSELSKILNDAINKNSVPYLTRNPIKSASEIGYTVYEINGGRKDTLGRRRYILEAKDAGGNTFYWEIFQNSKGDFSKVKRGQNNDKALFNRILQVASATSIEDLENGFLSQFRDGAVFIIENKGGAKPWYLSYDGKPTQTLRKALHTQDMAKANEILAALNDAERQGKEPYTIKVQPAWYIGHPECQEAVLFGMHSEAATPEEIAAFLQEARKYALAVSMKEMDAPSAADSEVGVSVSDADELAEDTLADPVAQDEAANEEEEAADNLDTLLDEEEEFLGGETSEQTQTSVMTDEELIESSIQGLGDAFQNIKKNLSGLKIMIKDVLKNAVNLSNSLEDIVSAYNKISGRSTVEIVGERVIIRGNNNNIISEFPRSDFEKIKSFLGKSETLSKIFNINEIAQEIHKARGENHQVDPAPFILEFFRGKVRDESQNEAAPESTQPLSDNVTSNEDELLLEPTDEYAREQLKKDIARRLAETKSNVYPAREENETTEDYENRLSDWLETNKEEIWNQIQEQVRGILSDTQKSDAIISIIEARARSAGLTPADFVIRRRLEFRKGSAGVLKNSVKGVFLQTDYLDTGNAIIGAFEKIDVNVLAHELGHLFRVDLERFGPQNLLEAAEKWAKVKEGNWTEAQEEKFAGAFEKYLRNGKAPTQELQGVFARFKAWLTNIYKALKGTHLDVRLSPEITRVFDALLTENAALDGRDNAGIIREKSSVDSATEQVDAEMAAAAPAGESIVDVIAQQMSKASSGDTVTITDANGVEFTLVKGDHGGVDIKKAGSRVWQAGGKPHHIANGLRTLGFVENTSTAPSAPVEPPSDSSTAALDAQLAELNEIVAQTEAMLADTPASVPTETPTETQSADEPTLLPPSPTTVRRRRRGQTTSEPVAVPPAQEPVQEVVEEPVPSENIQVENNLLKRGQVVERVKNLKEGETFVITDGAGFRYSFKKTAEGIEASFYGDTGAPRLYKNEKGIARYLSNIGFAETIVSYQETTKKRVTERQEKATDYSFSRTPTNHIFNELKRVDGLIKKLERDWKKAQEKSAQPDQNQLVKYKPLTKKRMAELKEMGDEAHDELAAKLREAMKVYLSDFTKLLQLSAARAGVTLSAPNDAQMNFTLNDYLKSVKIFVGMVNDAMGLEDSTFDFKNILSEEGRIADLSSVFDHIRNEKLNVPETLINGLLSVSDEESPLRGSTEVTEAEREFARVNLLFALSNTGVVSFDKLSSLMHLGAVRTVVNQAEAWRIVTANRSSVEPRYSVDGKIQGFVLNGRIYLVADELQRTGQYAGVFLHECGVHFRKFGMSDQGFKEILDAVRDRVQNVKALAEVKGKENLTNEEKAFLDAVRRVEKTGMDETNEHYWEEVTAYVVEKFPSTKQGLVGRVVSWFRTYLYRWGFLNPEDIRISDLVAFARGAARGIGVSNFSYNWSEVTSDEGVMDDLAEKFGITSDELLKQYTDTYRQYRYNEDGTEKGDYLKAPNGKRSNLVNDAYPADSVNSGKFGRERLWMLTRTPAFIEWFGDWINNPNENMSLDGNGEPRIVYRAANEDAVIFDDKLDATVFEDDKSQVFAGFVSSKDGSFRSVDNNGTFDRQSSNVKFSFIDVEAAKRLDESFGVITRLFDYEAAIEMYNNGAEEWEIKLFTNWHKGNDGIWRYELSDKDMLYSPPAPKGEDTNLIKKLRSFEKERKDLYLKLQRLDAGTALRERFVKNKISKELFGDDSRYNGSYDELDDILKFMENSSNFSFNDMRRGKNSYLLRRALPQLRVYITPILERLGKIDLLSFSRLDRAFSDFVALVENQSERLPWNKQEDDSDNFFNVLNNLIDTFREVTIEKVDSTLKRRREEINAELKRIDKEIDAIKNPVYNLEDIFYHEELFRAYPQLKGDNVKVKFENLGFFLKGVAKDLENGKFEIIINSLPHPDTVRSTILHEVQHVVQSLSGFARGGNPEEFESSEFNLILNEKLRDIQSAKDDLDQWLQENFASLFESYLFGLGIEVNKDTGKLSKSYLSFDDFNNALDAHFHSLLFSETLDEQIEKLDLSSDLTEYYSNEEMKDLRKEYKVLRDIWTKSREDYNILSKEPFELYRRIMGELEARVVQNRMNMTEEELRQRSISVTEFRDENLTKGELIDADSLFSPLHQLRANDLRFSISEEQSYSDIRKEVRGAPGVYLHGDGTFSFNQREMPQGRENETLVYGVVRGTRRARELASVQKLREWLRNNQFAEELGKVEAGNTVFPSNAREDLDTRLGAMMRWAILNEEQASEMLYSVDESGNPISFYEGVVQAIKDAAHVSLHTSQLDWTDEMMASVANALGGFENEVLDPSKSPTQIFAGLNRNMDRFSDANVFRDVVSSLAQNDAVEADDYDENGNGIIRPVDDSVESAAEEDNFEYVVNLDLENPNAGPAERREAMRAAIDRLKGARGVGWHNDLNDFYQNIAAKYDTEADEVNGAIGEPARREDVERFLEAALPFHIRERIEIHYDPVPLAKEILRGAYGIFFPFARGKKMIHVRAWDRTFAQVIATVAHESSHFGWSMWGSSRLEKAISDLYMHTDDDGNLVVAQKMYEVIPQYFQMFGYNESTLHMVPEARRVYLMDEYFARINHDLLGSNTTDVAAAMGIDSARYTELKREIDLAIAEVHSNLMRGTNGMADEETVKAFVEDILKMTMGSTIGRGVDAYYDIEGTDVGGGRRTPTNRVYIYVNDYGQRRQEVAQTDEGQMIAEIREVLQKWEGKFGRVGKNFAKFVLQNFPLRNHFKGIGKNGSIIPGLHVEHGKLGEQIATAHAAVMIGHVMRKISENMGLELRKRNDAYEYLVSVFKEKHFDPAVLDEHSGTTYVEKITDLGYGNDKKVMEAAKLADESIVWCRNQILGNALEIRRMIKLQADNLARRMRAAYAAANMNPNQIIERIERMYAQMGEMASKYSGEWTHRMYRSYSEEGYIDLAHMLDYLTRNPNDGRPRFKEEQEIAQRKLNNLDELRGKAIEDGGITEDMYRTMSEQPKRILRLAKRLDALEAYVKTKMGLRRSAEAGAEYPVIVLNRMIAEIKEVMGDSEKQMKGRIGDDHLNTISATMKRELDDRRQLDRLYMDFLEPETNRLKALLHSVDQQNKILMKLQFNMELGEHILDTGMGNLQGLGRGERRSSDLGFLERGSFLQFIEIEDIFMEALEKEYAVQRSLRETVWGGVIDAWKANNTIYSLKLGVSNYVGNISLLMAGGHFLRWGNMRVGSAVAWNQWKERMGLVDEADWRNREKEIIQLMRDNHLLGGTVSDTRMVVGNTGIHEQVVHEVFKGLRAINSIGFVGERQMENAVKNILNRFRQFYAYGDEWIKPMIFMNNLDVAYAKYEAMPEFADMSPEERKRLAAREAARQTMRETTTWEMTSRIARELSARSIRLITPDFVMHNFQMMRIIAANFVRHGEIGDELRKLDELERLQGRLTEKQVAYRSQLSDERVRRKVGGAFTMSAYGTLMATGMGLIPYLMNMFLATLNADSDDDEEKKKARRQKLEEGRNGAFTPREWDGAVRMVNWLTGGNNLHSPVFRDRWNIYTWNYVRSNAMLTHAPVRAANDEWHPSDVMYQMLTNMMDLQSGTMTQELINNVLGRDKWGREIGVEEGLLRVANRALIPGAVRQLWQVAFETPSTDTLYHSGKAIKVPELFGVTVNKYDIRDVANRLGYFLKEKQSNSGNYHRRDFKAALDRGKALSDGEILELVRKLKENNQYEMGKATYLLTGLREIGMTEQELMQYLTVSRKGADPLLGQEWTKKFLSGSKIFDESMIEHLKRERNTLIKGRESLRMSRQELATVLQNYDKAIRIYSQALRTN